MLKQWLQNLPAAARVWWHLYRVRQIRNALHELMLTELALARHKRALQYRLMTECNTLSRTAADELQRR